VLSDCRPRSPRGGGGGDWEASFWPTRFSRHGGRCEAGARHQATDPRARCPHPLRLGERLTTAQFALREERLRGHPWARDGMRQLECWLEGEQGAGLCETFRWRAGALRCPRRHRGSRQRLRGTGAAWPRTGHADAGGAREPAAGRGAQASILFSDVAPTCTAVPAGSTCPRWTASLRLHAATRRPWPALLGEDDVPSVLGSLPHRRSLRVRATAAQIDWHIEREALLCGAAGIAPARPSTVPGPAARCWCWAGNLKGGELVGLLLRATEAESAAAVNRGRAPRGQRRRAAPPHHLGARPSPSPGRRGASASPHRFAGDDPDLRPGAGAGDVDRYRPRPWV